MSISNKDYLDKLIAKAKKSWEGVNVDSYMQNLRDMDKETIRCRDLMVGDWITDEHGFPMQITTVGEDYAYATWEGNEGDPWEFCDKEGFEPEPIPLIPAILEKNGWWYDVEDMWLHDEVDFGIERWNGRFQCYNINQIKLDSAHQLQQVLRLAGMTDMANNFKV